MTPRIFGILNLVVAVFFALFVLVQYNDPDPLLWMVVYSVAALACVLYRLERLPPAVAAGYGVLALLLGLYLAYRVISQGQFFFDEEGREMMGSFLVASWMGVLYWRGMQPLQPQMNADTATADER
ncbi:MAG: transmembrane 220 family protein [Rhodothermales bacterium]